MKILNQYKTSITEPKNIWVEGGRVVGGDDYDCSYTLGVYTEQFARNVLSEIWQNYLGREPYYEMPTPLNVEKNNDYCSRL